MGGWTDGRMNEGRVLELVLGSQRLVPDLS